MLKQILSFFRGTEAYILPVAMGGALGALARYGVSSAIESQTLAVLICNICGSFILSAAIELKAKICGELEKLITVGFCGGFSIFASFSRDSVMALRAENFYMFFLNLSANFLLCICAVLSAQFLVEKFLYVRAYLKDSRGSEKYAPITSRMLAAIRHSLSRPKIESIPTIPNSPIPPEQTSQPSQSEAAAQSPSCIAGKPAGSKSRGNKQ